MGRGNSTFVTFLYEIEVLPVNKNLFILFPFTLGKCVAWNIKIGSSTESQNYLFSISHKHLILQMHPWEIGWCKMLFDLLKSRLFLNTLLYSSLCDGQHWMDQNGEWFILVLCLGCDNKSFIPAINVAQPWDK